MTIKKPITRDELQTKNILCKFLHYSVDQNSENVAKPEANLQLSPKSCAKLDNDSNSIDDNENKEFYFSHYNKESKMSEMVARKLDQIEDGSDSHFPGFLRNVLWTFEDIRMLVASSMPIFGDANHPAVSLRLHDVNRPINVLTGLDYWLDNLMSSVPEVVMCYHLDGIVEKYGKKFEYQLKWSLKVIQSYCITPYIRSPPYKRLKVFCEICTIKGYLINRM